MVELLTPGSRGHGSSRAFVPGSWYRDSGLLKTMVLLLIVLACFAGPMAQTASATITVDQFVAKTMGQELSNAQGTFKGECVSLVSQYLLQVYGITTGQWGNAVDYRSGGSGGNHLAANGFTWSTNQSFVNGDILVWEYNPGFAYTAAGHIAVWYNGKIYDQNNAGRRTAGLAPYSPLGFVGHWRKSISGPPAEGYAPVQNTPPLDGIVSLRSSTGRRVTANHKYNRTPG